jgi:Domain of unknown function (DUF4157)
MMAKQPQILGKHGHAIPRKRTDEAGLVSDRAQPLDPRVIVQRAALAPESLRPADILRLQQTIGNRAVGRLLSQLFPAPSLVQAKLTVNAPGDKYEQEADRVAEEVTQKPAVQPAELEGEEDETPEVMTKPQPSPLAGGAFEAGEAFEQQLNAARGQGQALPPALREDFERKFGADFGGVRIHGGAQADQLNQSIQANAFTTGRDIFFRQGLYDPASRSGQTVIAHELTHVMQQNQGQWTMPGSRPPAIQRLISGTKLQQEAGDAKSNILWYQMSARYKSLIDALNMYQVHINVEKVDKDDQRRAGQAHGINSELGEIKDAASTYTREHVDEKDNSSEKKGDRYGKIDKLKTDIFDEGKIVNNVATNTIWRSPDLNQWWGEAIALQRTGVTPRRGLSPGDFIDKNLTGPLTPLGSGAVNTVFSGKYRQVSEEKERTGIFGAKHTPTFSGVYKTEEHKEQTDPDKTSKIPKLDRNYAARNVAMSKLNELLGLDVIPRTEFAINDGYFGTVMEKVEQGEHAQKEIEVEVLHRAKPTPPSTPMDKQNPSPEWATYKTEYEQWKAWDDAKSYINYFDPNSDEYMPNLNPENFRQAGSPRWKVENDTIIKRVYASTQINFSDPNLMRGLSNLQLIDAIAGSSDRHIGNYMIVRKRKTGEVVAIKGIDNDFSFGSTTIDELKASPGRKNLGIPAIVDKAVAKRIMEVTPNNVRAILEPLLDPVEVQFAVDRFKEVQAALKALKESGKLIDNWHDPNLPATMTLDNDNYVARDKKTVEALEKKGLIAARR